MRVWNRQADYGQPGKSVSFRITVDFGFLAFAQKPPDTAGPTAPMTHQATNDEAPKRFAPSSENTPGWTCLTLSKTTPRRNR